MIVGKEKRNETKQSKLKYKVFLSFLKNIAVNAIINGKIPIYPLNSP